MEEEGAGHRTGCGREMEPLPWPRDLLSPRPREEVASRGRREPFVLQATGYCLVPPTLDIPGGREHLLRKLVPLLVGSQACTHRCAHTLRPQGASPLHTAHCTGPAHRTAEAGPSRTGTFSPEPPPSPGPCWWGKSWGASVLRAARHGPVCGSSWTRQ